MMKGITRFGSAPVAFSPYPGGCTRWVGVRGCLYVRRGLVCLWSSQFPSVQSRDHLHRTHLHTSPVALRATSRDNPRCHPACVSVGIIGRLIITAHAQTLVVHTTCGRLVSSWDLPHRSTWRHQGQPDIAPQGAVRLTAPQLPLQVDILAWYLQIRVCYSWVVSPAR